MRRSLWVGICFAISAMAKTGNTPAPPAQTPRESNEHYGVDIGRSMGYPVNKTVHLSHGTLLTHSILRRGNPYEPGPQGALLEYRKDLSTATLLPNSRTPLSTLPDESFFYVKSGEARLDDGKQYWDTW
jgi:hypothetical protein